MNYLSRISVAALFLSGVLLAALPTHGAIVGPRLTPASGLRTPWPRGVLTPRQRAILELNQSAYWTQACYQAWEVSKRRSAACQAPIVTTNNGRFSAMRPAATCPLGTRPYRSGPNQICCNAMSAGSPAYCGTPPPTPRPTPTPVPLPTVQVDVRHYIAPAISSGNNGNMLCVGTGNGYDPSCLTSFYDGNQYGETEIPNANGIIDYIAISSEQVDIGVGDGPINEIGVARNYPADGGDPLRCFTIARNPSINCTAPPSGHVFGMPYLIHHLPVVSWATVQATEHDPDPTKSDAWPTRGIPGAVVTTPTGSDGYAPPNYWNYTVNNYGSNCSQSFHFNTYSLGTVVYVTGVPFGGNVGTRDALVTDGFSFANPSTLERYYYVYGLGRVRENNAQGSNGQYGANGQNLDRNQEKPVNLNVIYGSKYGNSGGCPQGSALPIY